MLGKTDRLQNQHDDNIIGSIDGFLFQVIF